MSRLPYARNLAARGQVEQFPAAAADEPSGRPSYRRMMTVTAPLAVWLAESVVLTVNAAWWHFSPPWFLPAVVAGNAATCGALVLWMRRR